MESPRILFCLIPLIFSALYSVNSRELPKANATQALNQNFTYDHQQALNQNFTYDHQLRQVPSGPNGPCEPYMIVSETVDFGGGYMEFVHVINSCEYCKAYDVVIDCSVAYGDGAKCNVKDGYPLYPLEQWTMHYQGSYGQFPVLSGEYRDCTLT